MQPQQAVRLDRANSLIIGLQSAIDHNGVDVVRNILPESITAPRTVGKVGFGLTFADGAEVAKCAPFLPAITNFTTVTLIVPNFSSASNARAGIYDYQASAGSAQDRLRLIWLDSSNGFYIDTNGGFAASCKPSFSAGDVLSVAFTRTVSSGQQFYINGSAVSTTNVATSNTSGPTAAVPTWLGDDVEAASGWRFNGQILLHLYYNRVLSATEIKSLALNPWQIFAADDASLFFDYVSSGGSGVTLTGSGSTQNNSSTSAGISQTHIITGGGTSQGNATTSGAISQEHILSGSISSQANESTSGALGSGAILLGANADQANRSTSGAISQAHILSGSGAAQANQSTSGAISDGSPIVLTGSDCNQSNSGGSGAIDSVVRRGGGIYWQNQPKRKIKRSKLDQMLDTMGVEDVAEDFQEFVEEHAEKKTIKQAIRKHVTPSNEIKWPSLENDIAAIKKLLAEYEQYLIDQDDEDILPFLMELI